MNDVIADTHAAVWSIFAPAKLSVPALAAMTRAARAGTIFVSAISVVEIIYLTGKKSFPYTGALARLVALHADPNEPFKILPVTLADALAVERVPRNEVPDMPDRIIAATAVARGLPVVSADSDIRGSAGLKSLVPVIW